MKKLNNNLKMVPLASLHAHPDNPRLALRDDVVKPIAANLKKRGEIAQMFALIVRPNPKGKGYQIVAGHHRFEAAEQAGLKSVWCWIEDLTDDEAYMLLATSNAQGELFPLEIGLHVLKYVKKAKGGKAKGGKKGKKGGLTAYAKALGRTHQYITQLRHAAEVYEDKAVKETLAEAVEEEVIPASQLAGMVTKAKHLTAIHDAPKKSWPGLVMALVDKDLKFKNLRKLVDAAIEAGKNLDDDDAFNVIHGGFQEVKEDKMESESIDIIVTDPPYGEEHISLYEDLSAAAARVLKPNGIAVVMCGQSYLPDVMQALGKHLTYHWTCAYLTPGGQAPHLFERNVNTFWKPVLVYCKGEFDRDTFGDVAQSDTNDNDKAHHHWGQSESGMYDLMQRFCLPGETILDPFCGGGTTGVIAVHLGCKFTGIDIDKQAVETTIKRIIAEKEIVAAGKK